MFSVNQETRGYHIKVQKNIMWAIPPQKEIHQLVRLHIVSAHMLSIKNQTTKRSLQKKYKYKNQYAQNIHNFVMSF